MYNEFSGGKQDITAIRDLVKYLKDKNSGIRNLLLFGRGSYDYKNYLPNNKNFVPTYESRNSLSPLETYSSDDYFGFLENNEGTWNENPPVNHTLDIGVGRFPIKKAEEGDILIGKITPKGETDPSPEEKLLRAIFGDKAGDVKDASLRVSPSIKGVIINKKLFSRVIKDKKAKAEEKPMLEKLDADYEKNNYNLKLKLVDKLFTLVNNRTSQGVTNILGEQIIPRGTKFTQKLLERIDYSEVNPGNWTTDKDKNEQIERLLDITALNTAEEYLNKVLAKFRRSGAARGDCDSGRIPGRGGRTAGGAPSRSSRARPPS